VKVEWTEGTRKFRRKREKEKGHDKNILPQGR
jgi:hypothetical protein